MALHQYIGARYVPYYYENSLDPTSTEWEPNVNYEALTVVTLPNQHSYISKKAVPDTIGSPALNAEYWLDTGSVNGYIQDLQDQIDDINDNKFPAIDSDINALNDLTGRLKQLKNRNVVWISDSYGDQSNEHPAIIDGIVGFNNFYNLATGSTGFTGKEGSADQSTALEWKTILTTWVNSQTDETLESIDDVYISGGFNDVYSTSVSTIKSYILAFMTYAKSVLPNANFHLVFCGWAGGKEGGDVTTPTETAKGANFRYRLANKVMIAYSQCQDYGMEYMGNAINALHNYGVCFTADDYHPSQTGQDRLARQILNYMLGGGPLVYTNVIDGNPKQILTESNQVNVSPYYTIFTDCSYDNEDITFRYRTESNLGVPYTPTVNLVARQHHVFGHWTSQYLAPVQDGVNVTYYTIPVYLQTASTLIPAELTLYPGGSLDIFPWEAIAANTSFYIIPRSTLTMKIWEC